MSVASLPLTHQRAKKQLLERIRSRHKPGDRLEPVDELARQLGAGRSSMYRAVRELAAEGVLQSRPRLGTYVLDTGASAASHELSLASRTVHLAVRNGDVVRDFPQMIEAIKRGVTAHGGRLEPLVFNPHEEPDILAGCGGDSAIMINPRSPAVVRRRPGQSLVEICMGCHEPTLTDAGLDIVTVDQRQGGYVAGVAARQAGFESACYMISQNIGLAGAALLRLEGFEAGFGRPVDRKHIFEVGSSDRGDSAVAQWQACDPRPAFMFAMFDDLARYIVDAAMARNLWPGRDFYLMGFDGQSWGRQLLSGPLSTVELPLADMGSIAVDYLVDRVRKPNQPTRRTAVGCRLFAGATAGLEPSTCDSSAAMTATVD